MFRGCPIKAWSKTQTTIALSTGEAELCALAKAAAEGMGLKSLLRDLGLEADFTLHTDASAAIGIASRQGLGRIRHLATTDLWLQQRVKHRDLIIKKISGDLNPSDLLTKVLDSKRMHFLLELMGTKIWCKFY